MTEEKIKQVIELHHKLETLQKAYDTFNDKMYVLGFARKTGPTIRSEQFSFEAYESFKIKDILDNAHKRVLTDITAEIAETEQKLAEL